MESLRPRARRTLSLLLITGSAAAAVVGLFNLRAGGTSIVIGPVRLASSGLIRPLAAAAVLLAAATWFGADDADRRPERRPGHLRSLAVACAALTLMVGILF